MKKLHICYVFMLVAMLCDRVHAQQSTEFNADVLAYIEKYHRLAMSEMERTGIPACITLAQGLLESGNGKSVLSLKSNNHFGIKCKTSWAGEKVYHDDDEKGECFRKYASVEQSYIDHSDFLKNSPRYASLFSYDVNNYKSWARGLKAAGYATNPEYAPRLVSLIERYNLDKFTMAYWAKVKNQPDAAASTYEMAAKAATISMDTLIEREIYTHVMNEETAPLLLRPDNTPDRSNIKVVKTKQSKVFDAFKIGEQLQVNHVPAICLSEGSSLLVLAEANNIPLAQIYKYNDLTFQAQDNDLLSHKMLIYLAPKRGRASIQQHKLRHGETLHDIAQLYGVKLKKILRFNRLKPGEKPIPNEVLYLRAYAPAKPTIET